MRLATLVTTHCCLMSFPFQSVRSYSYSLESLCEYLQFWIWLSVVERPKRHKHMLSDIGYCGRGLRCILYKLPCILNLCLFLPWSYKVWTSPSRLQREERWHIEGEHDEAKESWVAGDQSIIAPVSLYWLCSHTGLSRSMCFQAFCVGRLRSVPGLTLTFYSDTCVCVCEVYEMFFGVYQVLWMYMSCRKCMCMRKCMCISVW